MALDHGATERGELGSICGFSIAPCRSYDRDAGEIRALHRIHADVRYVRSRSGSKFALGGTGVRLLAIVKSFWPNCDLASFGASSAKTHRAAGQERERILVDLVVAEPLASPAATILSGFFEQPDKPGSAATPPTPRAASRQHLAHRTISRSFSGRRPDRDAHRSRRAERQHDYAFCKSFSYISRPERRKSTQTKFA